MCVRTYVRVCVRGGGIPRQGVENLIIELNKERDVCVCVCVREREIPRRGIGYQKFNIYSRLKEKERGLLGCCWIPPKYILIVINRV